MRSTRLAVIVAILAASVFVSLADPASTTRPEVTLSNTEVHELRSESLDQEFVLSVARPFGPPPPSGKYPVVYLLDAEISFPLVRQVALSLLSQQEMPPVLIVGIGYAGGPRVGGSRRTRDYTPTADPVFTRFAQRWGGSADGEKASGGADAFLGFVRKELKPFIEANYPVDPKDATLFGVSFGGLFATYALLEKPDTFQRYIIGSPSLWWDSRAIFKTEKSYAEKHEDLSAKVFIAAGGRETSEHDEASLARLPEAQRRPMEEMQKAMGGSVQMLEVVKPFVQKLEARSYPGLDLTFHIFPDETHGSAPPMTIGRGLKVVFGTF